MLLSSVIIQDLSSYTLKRLHEPETVQDCLKNDLNKCFYASLEKNLVYIAAAVVLTNDVF